MAEPDGVPPPPWSGSRLWLTGLVTLVVLGVLATGVWVATRPTGPMYRTAVAGPGSVSAVLATTGTIRPVSEATVSFPVSGLVESVTVQEGQAVVAGQPLAQLNTTTLAAQVSSARVAAADASARLVADQDSQTGAVRSATAGTSSPNVLSDLVTAQNAVKDAQRRVDADLALVNAAMRQERTSCPAAIQSLHAAPRGSARDPSAADTSDVSRCAALLQQVLDAQTKAAADENALASAEADLATALSHDVDVVTTAATSTATPGGRSGGPASAERIAADQASVDAAAAALAAARQSLAAATLVSPIAGTVARVGLTVGQSVPANSTQAYVVIIGPGTNEVITSVSDTQVGRITPGQPASVTPDGATGPITGQVTAIGALATATVSGSTAYPVTISLRPASQRLFAGATASVTITLATTQAAVTVPTSAVHRVGTVGFVVLLVGDKPTNTRVSLGVIGATLVEVTSGLQAGARVVLADLNQPLPTASGVRGGFGGGG